MVPSPEEWRGWLVGTRVVAALLIQTNYMPRYYAVVIATGGPNSESNRSASANT